MTKIINLAGSCGAGKSRTALELCSLMIKAGLNVELVSEWVKEAVWEERNSVFKNQILITANQHQRMLPICGKVDYIVTDSPLFLGGVYSPNYFPSYNNFLLELFNSYNNINFLLTRCKPYCSIGRVHTEEESNRIALELKEYMIKNDIPHEDMVADDEAPKRIFDIILKSSENCRICGRELSVEQDIYIKDGICNFCQVS